MKKARLKALDNHKKALEKALGDLDKAFDALDKTWSGRQHRSERK